MAIHKHNSWGRTRSPKNIAGPHGTAVALESVPTTSATAGYRTENQRFLHIWIDANGANDSVIVYAFNYATAKWATLQAMVGVRSGAHTTFDLAMVPVEIACSTTEKYIIVDIAGADRVAFVQDGSTDTVTLYAACSTF